MFLVRAQLLVPWWISGPGLAGLATVVGLTSGMNATAAAGVYVLSVVAASLVGRLKGALATSTICFFCLNYYFTPPRLTFAVEKGEDLVALVVFLIVATVVSGLFSSLTAEQVRAEMNEEQAREAKLESAASDLRAAVFSAVTHDLKTPITSIKASVDSLMDIDEARLGDGGVRELLEGISTDADRLNRLVGNVLDLARVKAGAMDLHLVEVDILELLGVVLNRIRPFTNGTMIEVKTAPYLPEVKVDVIQMDHVLTNILENAVRFSPPRSAVEVDVKVQMDAVEIKVVDHGPGIPNHERAHVLEPFYRLSRDSATQGSGLGLAIVSAMVTAHGGHLGLEETPGGGTTVVTAIPLRPA
ncbi:MAG: ATP-binding protein [Actinomycetota bacterium]